MPRTLPTPTRTRVRAGSLRDTLGIAWEENADRLVDTGTFFGGVCHVPHDLFDTCADDLNKTGTSGEGSVEVPVFGFYESGTCTTAADPSVIERLMTDVAQKAANSQSFNVERGLWNGRADSVPAADTWFLASSGAADPNGGVATGIVPGLADMVTALDAALGGERGIVHVPHFLIPFLQFYGQIDRQGNVLSLNHTDHLLVAGTGYDGSDPDGNVTAGEPWIYGTGPVGVLVSPTINLSSVDWETNTLTVYSENSAAAYFSPCAHIGIPVCIPDPGPECGAS